MRGYINSGDILEVVTPLAGFTSGQIVQVGELVGVSDGTYVEDDIAQIFLKGAIDVAKTAADVVAQGDLLYFNAGTGELTIDDAAGVNVFAGWAFEAAAASETIVRVKLKN